MRGSNLINNNQFFREKALKALEKAKLLESKQLKEGKKYIKINTHTRVLR